MSRMADQTAAGCVHVELSFDPFMSSDEEIRKVFRSATALTLWCLWKRLHVVDEAFNREVLAIAANIDEVKPDDQKALIGCMRIGGIASRNFTFRDIEDFVEDFADYFTGRIPRKRITVETPPSIAAATG